MIYKSETNINRGIYEPTIKERALKITSGNKEVISSDQDSEDNSDDWKWVSDLQDDSPEDSHPTEVTDISDDLKELLNMFAANNISVRMTSGFRSGAKTKQGNTSKHSLGEAMDIVPVDGNFVNLIEQIKANKAISDFMKSKGYGIIDESTAEMLARTGGSGPHLHVGTDKLAQDFWV